MKKKNNDCGEGVYYNLASLNRNLIEVGTIHAHFDRIQFARSEEKWLKLCAFKSRRPTVSANWTGQTTTTHWCEDWLNNRVFMYQYCKSTGDSIARPFCISRSFLFSIASKRALMFHCRVYRFLGLGRQSFTTISSMEKGGQEVVQRWIDIAVEESVWLIHIVIGWQVVLDDAVFYPSLHWHLRGLVNAHLILTRAFWWRSKITEARVSSKYNRK